MYTIGYDIGSSSVKASIIDVNTGNCIASSFQPKVEMPINSVQSGWAEQDPEMWWKNLVMVTHDVLNSSRVNPTDIKAIGISYQMHGLVIIDKNKNVLRPSIIWCDSRAVSIGEKAFIGIGEKQCLENLLNSPGNFTASKLKWVKDNEPRVFDQIHKMMLPGDYIAMRLTGEIFTTISGLSEGILWDFKQSKLSSELLSYYAINKDIIPEITETFKVQGELTASIARELGLKQGTPVSYRSGDQPNNALSLNVLNPGEVAATAGTSGVVYGVSDVIQYDPKSRVNTFAHVNHSEMQPRLGVLLCINGTGILNSWVKKNFLHKDMSYDEMNSIASKIPIGSDGVMIYPFGNGAERMFSNKVIGCILKGINFNTHSTSQIIRAVQEGIALSFRYGMDIMKGIGIQPQVIRAGFSNMFLSPVFAETLSNIIGTTIELYNTDGSQGAARGAGIGAGIYKSTHEAFAGLKKIKVVEPSADKKNQFENLYNHWFIELQNILKVN